MKRLVFALLLMGAPLAAAAACDECGTILGVREIPRPGATTGEGAMVGALKHDYRVRLVDRALVPIQKTGMEAQ